MHGRYSVGDGAKKRLKHFSQLPKFYAVRCCLSFVCWWLAGGRSEVSAIAGCPLWRHQPTGCKIGWLVSISDERGDSPHPNGLREPVSVIHLVLKKWGCYSWKCPRWRMSLMCAGYRFGYQGVEFLSRYIRLMISAWKLFFKGWNAYPDEISHLWKAEMRVLCFWASDFRMVNISIWVQADVRLERHELICIYPCRKEMKYKYRKGFALPSVIDTINQHWHRWVITFHERIDCRRTCLKL